MVREATPAIPLKNSRRPVHSDDAFVVRSVDGVIREGFCCWEYAETKPRLPLIKAQRKDTISNTDIFVMDKQQLISERLVLVGWVIGMCLRKGFFFRDYENSSVCFQFVDDDLQSWIEKHVCPSCQCTYQKEIQNSFCDDFFDFVRHDVLIIEQLQPPSRIDQPSWKSH